jgi:(p)ppGpp synthase/HD superfamily hydrolase
MREHAQTNLQLYNQLVARGWSDAELACARRAYELATDLFAGQLRPSGKTFVAHVVGTASALAAAGARAELVVAGLIHAAYTHGDFGDGRWDAAEFKRTIVRAAVGATAEALVDEYARLPYTTAAVDDWLERAAVLRPTEHDLVVIRLANEVDVHTDLGARYFDRGEPSVASDARFAALGALAERMDELALAEPIRSTSARERGADVPEVLWSVATRSYTTAPRSYRLRFEVALRRTALAAKLRRMPALRRTAQFLRRAG